MDRQWEIKTGGAFYCYEGKRLILFIDDKFSLVKQ